jgi:hypothetical protein
MLSLTHSAASDANAPKYHTGQMFTIQLPSALFPSFALLNSLNSYLSMTYQQVTGDSDHHAECQTRIHTPEALAFAPIPSWKMFTQK